MRLSKKSNYIILTIAIFLGFLMFGFSENIKGPAIPKIQSDFFINEMQIGMLLSLNSIGYLLACTYSGWLTRKIGLKLTNILCFVIMAVSGVLIYFSKSFIAFSGSYFIMYLGNGMLEISLGILSAKIFTKNTGTMMNLSHFFYGLSSMVAPILSTKLMRINLNSGQLGWRGMYLVVLVVTLIPVLPSILGKFPQYEEEKQPMSIKSCMKDSNLWIIVLVLSFGVTCEMGVSGWLVNYLEKAHNFTMEKSSLVLSAFFFCFMTARLVFGPIIDKIGFVKSILIASMFSATTIIIGVIMGSSGIVLLILSGFGVAIIYPTVMALIAKIYPESIDIVMTFILTIMGISIVVGNFLIGAVTDLFKVIFTNLYSLEIGIKYGYSMGFIFIGVCCLICFISTLALINSLRNQESIV